MNKNGKEKIKRERQTFHRCLGRKTARCSFGRSDGKGTSRRLDEEDDGELWQREGRDDGDAVKNKLVNLTAVAWKKTYADKTWDIAKAIGRPVIYPRNSSGIK